MIGASAALVVLTLAGSASATPVLVALIVLAGAAAVPGLDRHRVPGGERRWRELSGEMDRLAEANRVLVALNDLGRSLPSNLDLDEVLVAIRAQLVERFEAQRMAIFTLDDERWYPELVVGIDVDGLDVVDTLPAPLGQALTAPTVLRIDDLSQCCDRTGSGLYGRLVIDGAEHGVLAVEHPQAGRFDDDSVELFDGFSQVVALSIDNARSFGRLRSLAAAEERSRIARDLHDRLGQWLTYISLELERYNTGLENPSPELDRLQDDVRSAIAELRDALVELRTTIRAERPLGVVLVEVIERFRERTGLTVELTVPVDPTARLNGVVENELLRIVQESLTNIEKHADATAVHVNWSVEGGRGILTIEDNGRGFDPGRGVRSTAYGLVGMRERAAAVGAILEISSQNGIGTVVTVLIGTTEEHRP